MAKGLCFKRRASIGHADDSPGAARRQLGPVPRARPHAPLQRAALQVQLALVLGHRQRRHRQPGRARNGVCRWGLGDGNGPRPRSPAAASTPTSTTRRRPTPSSPPSITAGARLSSKCAASTPAAKDCRCAPPGSAGQRRTTPSQRRSFRLPPDSHQSHQRRHRQPVLRHPGLGVHEPTGIPGVQGRVERLHHGKAPSPAPAAIRAVCT